MRGRREARAEAAATVGGTLTGLKCGFQLNWEAREAPGLWLESSLPAMAASSLDCGLLPGVLLLAGVAPTQGHTGRAAGGPCGITPVLLGSHWEATPGWRLMAAFQTLLQTTSWPLFKTCFNF